MSVILQVHCYWGEVAPLFSGRSHSNEVPFFNRGALQEQTRLVFARFNGEHPFLSPCSWFCTDSHTSWRGRHLSRWPLCWPLTNALPLCAGVLMTSAEHAYLLFLHLFFVLFFFNSQTVFVPHINESMYSFQIPPPYILLYLNRFVMCIAYFSFLLWLLFQGFLKAVFPH